MSELLSHSLTYSQDVVEKIFVKALFAGDDLTPQMDLILNAKENLNIPKLTFPSKIVRDGASLGFSGATGATITNVSLTVKTLKNEWGDNADVFLKTAIQQYIATGVDKDDVLAMSTPQIYTNVVLPAMAKVVKKDFNALVWFGDTKLETMTGTLPNQHPTGTADSAYEGLI
jgi:hypothetical protein